MYADDARWLVSTVLWKTASGQVDEQNYVYLAYRILRRVMNGTTCTAVIQSLIEGEGLMRSNYRVGVHCYGYQLSHRFLGDDWKQVRLIDPRLINRIKREEMRIEKQQAKRRRPIHRQLASIQEDLTTPLSNASIRAITAS